MMLVVTVFCANAAMSMFTLPAEKVPLLTVSTTVTTVKTVERQQEPPATVTTIVEQTKVTPLPPRGNEPEVPQAAPVASRE